MSKIIMKCPHCGQWCVAEHKGNIIGSIDRFKKGMMDAVDDAVDVGMDLGNALSFGNEKIAKVTEIVGGVVGGYVGGTSVLRGLRNVVKGDKFQFVCPNCKEKWSTNDEKDDQIKLYQQEEKSIQLRKMFTETNDYPQYIKQLEMALDSPNNTNVSKAILYDSLAAAYFICKQNDKALEYVDLSLSLFDNDNASHALKGLILGSEGDVCDVYNAMSELIYCKSEDFSSPFFKIEEFIKHFDIAWSKFSIEFLKLPIDRRKFIYLTSNTNSISSEVLVLSIHSLPKDIEFRGGISMEDTLYIMHPYKHNCYIPAKSYETEIFRDEVDEFVHIMDCLGAKHIAYVDERSASNTHHQQEETAIEVGAGYKGYSGSGKYNSGDIRDLGSNLHNKLEKGTDFDLCRSKKPYIPQDVVWYHQRERWRQDCQSRLDGRLRKAKFIISTSLSETISNSEKKKVNAEINALNLVNCNTNYEGNQNYMSSNEESHTWTCDVEFYPLSAYRIWIILLLSFLSAGVIALLLILLL